MRFLVGFLLSTVAIAPAQSLGMVIREVRALGAETGVCVIDERGEVVFAHRADVPVAPASNQKVLTAAAVLHGLGDDYRFATRFELVDGALVVRASGDPNWISETVHEPFAKFGEVAAKLQRLGVSAVREVVLDPGVFRGPARPASWPQNQLHASYCAPTGPFVLEQGVFELRIDPQGQSRSARVSLLSPPFGPEIEGRVQLLAQRANPTCGAIDCGDSILVRGKVWRRSGAVEIRTSVADPGRWYERCLRGVLAQAGIRTDESARPGHAGLVHEVTTSIGPALLRLLGHSSNFDAEQLTRVLGAERRRDGSLAGGMAAVEGRLRDLVGPLPEGTALVDGSGLSQDNRVTPSLVARTLHAVRDLRIGTALLQALPVAGESGTLENRFLGSSVRGKVHAKTGWIRGSSSLSGYVETADGRQLVFSILMDYDRRKNGLNEHLKRAQERIVEAVAAGRTS